MSKVNNTIFLRHYQELRKSFVDDRLINLNVNSLDGFPAQQKYFEYWEGDRLTSGAPSGRLLEKTNHLLHGTWFVYLQTSLGSIPHFKPDKPRRIDGDIIKYEQIKGAPNGLFLPRITYSHIKLIAERNSIKNYPKGDLDSCYEKAWEWIAASKKITIAITEGWKKTLALMSVGIPAIGLSGVYNFNNSSRDKTLIPAFNNFKGHKFCFYYDNDKKKKTRKNVTTAAKKLSKQLSVSGISKDFERCTWSNTKSKGIDDYLFDHNGDEKHLKYEPFISGQTFQPITPNLVLNRKYLTDDNRECCNEIATAINQNRLTVINSPKGTAKTEAISDYTAQFQEFGIKILVPTHRVQLMSELSRRFQIANASNYKTSLDEALGLSLCVDSMHEKSSVKFNLQKYADCILVVDEIDQVLDHLISSTTEVRKHRPKIIQNFVKLLSIVRKIIVASADISQDVVDFLELNSGEKAYVISNEYKQKSGSCTIYSQTRPELFLKDFFKAVDSGENILMFTSSQKVTSSYSTQNLEILLQKKYPHCKIMRIDAETIVNPQRKEYMCMKNINNFIEREAPDVLLISPVLETGIDISSTYFDSYWGMNWGVSSVNSFSQAMARVRAPIPRCIWSSNSSFLNIGNGSCFSSGLRNSQKHQLFFNELTFHSFDDELDWYTNDSCTKYWCERGAVVNTQNTRLMKSVMSKFASDYKTININDDVPKKEEKDAMTQKIKTNKTENISERYDQIISSPYLDDSSFKDLVDKKDKTLDERCTQRKNRLIRYISPQSRKVEISHQLLQDEDAGFFSKINLHWLVKQGLSTAHEMDMQRLQENEFSIDLNNKCMVPKVAYLLMFGVLDIINNPSEEYYSKHPLIVEVGAKVRSGFNKLKEADLTIRDLWSLRTLSPKSLDINLTKWCLELLGFTLELSKRTKSVKYFSLCDLAVESRYILMNFWDVERFGD